MAAAQPTTETKPKRKRKAKTLVTRGKRKEATARATIRAGTGVVRFNGLLLDAVQSPYVRQIISEPLRFVDAKQFDVSINAHGGGTMGQAQAARTALARALVGFAKDESLKSAMMEADRSLLVEDSRRIEPKKFKGPKARARFTKSYR